MVAASGHFLDPSMERIAGRAHPPRECPGGSALCDLPATPSPRAQTRLEALGFRGSPDSAPFATLLGLVEGPGSSVFSDPQPAGRAPSTRSVWALGLRRRRGWSRHQHRAGGQRPGDHPRKAASGPPQRSKPDPLVPASRRVPAACADLSCAPREVSTSRGQHRQQEVVAEQMG